VGAIHPWPGAFSEFVRDEAGRGNVCSFVTGRQLIKQGDVPAGLLATKNILSRKDTVAPLGLRLDLCIGKDQMMRYTPRFESLEHRTVPSTISFNPTTATLTVTGTTKKDSIVITDDGTNNASAVVVTSNGGTLFTSGPTAGVDQVHTITVNTHGGNKDSVVYVLTGNMTANNRSVTATFGNGKSDKFKAAVNGNLVNSFLLLQATGGGGGDTLSGSVAGSLNGSSFLGFIYKGGTGKDNINVNATDSVAIGPLAQLTVTADGGSQADNVKVGYEGQMQGAFFLNAAGSAGKDNVGADVTFDGVSNGLLFGPMSPNSGKAAAQVTGGGGSDHLSFEVDLSGTLKPASAAEIDGGAGEDFCTEVGAISGVFNCEH
jgi:hypothetical protein